MFKLLWQKKALILFLAVLVVLLPPALSRPAQMLSKTILTEATIDKIFDEGIATYTLSGKIVTQPGTNSGSTSTASAMSGAPPPEKPQRLTASGPTIGAAINNLSKSKQREVSFAHCSLLILGPGLGDENLAETLKYFLYKTELSNNCALAWGEGGRKTTLEQFFKSYRRPTSTSILTQGPAETAVFKNGRYSFSLDPAKTLALEFARGQTPTERFILDTHVLRIKNSGAKIRGNTVKISAKMELETNPTASGEELDNIAGLIEKNLEKNVSEVLEYCYLHDADVLGLEILRTQFNIKVDVSVISA